MKKLIVLVTSIMFLIMSATALSGFGIDTSTLNDNLKRIEIEKSFFGDPPIEEWNKTFGGIKYDIGNTIQVTNDGGFIIVGITKSFGSGNEDIWLIKTDADGNKLWDKTFGGANSDTGNYVQQTTDGGFIIVGSTESDGVVDYDIWLIKTDSEGNKIWDKTFGEIWNDAGFSVQQTSDGGYIILGNSGFFSSDIWLIKTDSIGNIEWKKVFGGIGWEAGSSVQQTLDGGYILTGGKTVPFRAEDVWLIKTDGNGNKLWDKTYGGKYADYSMFVQQTFDEGYIMVGSTWSINDDIEDIWLYKTDSNGNLEWHKTYGGVDIDISMSVQQTFDGGYIITGFIDSYTHDNDVVLIKTDVNGNKLWDKTFGGKDDDFGNFVQQTPDGGYIIVGNTKSYGAGSFDIFLIKASDFENQRPVSMELKGSSSGSPGESYKYTLSSIDPDGEDVYYWIDWNDGTYKNWIGPYYSGATIEVNHTWTKRGIYNIKAKSQDINGGESDWATLEVTIPRTRTSIVCYWLRFVDIFPILQRMLDLIK